ncbi:hypothetical protein B0H17DRAFT_1187522 [Mycena rosella]|uniref:Uncharacterized protein n=1 Tax=Mycena rosella TaxID=1033263 RepID=A0AAD7BZM0_MYCRO|nr:hypothetical protein B0H17DRAFT_1187522 [Mycena rosella]
MLLDDYQHIDSSTSPDYLVRSDSIRFLLCFGNSTSVTIVSMVGISLDNDTVAEMARAWHRIEVLTLSSHYAFPAHPRINPQCLDFFARYCPHLSRLCITFDGTILPYTSTATCVPQESLTHVAVEYSTISAPISVARFLSAIFPALETIDTDREFDDNEDLDALALYTEAIGHHRHWKEVETLIPHLVAVRAEERIRVQSSLVT